MLNPELNAKYSNLYNKNNLVFYKNYRINVLTNHILRIEKSKNKVFIDNPSEMVINRNTSDVKYQIKISNKCIFITTDDVIFKIVNLNNIQVSFDKGKTFIKEGKNLLGTRTTLDACFRKCKLSKGIISKNGLSIIDDSKSMIFSIEGSLSYRNNFNKDIYIFACLNYKELLKEYFIISGNAPMLPRYSFGNWWSRYWKYNEKSYLELMDKFKNEDVPLSVSVIDAEWHYFNTVKDLQPFYKDKLPKYHNYSLTGWTGYTFNKELFPDPIRFLNQLKERGLKATLNLHMNEGVLPHEDAYNDMKNELGATGSLNEVEFNIGNPKFINAYFKHLHHPLEKMGVDFFWLDWQQWKMKKKLGVDPLFSLNHFHYIDNCKNNNRGLILSRYSGLGAHRYPIGFSGDTFMNWSILKFIPYFTANATNVGYEIWSHDIGGHMFGYSDDELYTRWIEFGCFSPINRLHSSNIAGMSKEPWCHNNESSEIAKYYLRLRNKLVPYIYNSYYDLTNNKSNFIAPLYYEYDDKEIFKDKNTYLFGSSLLIHPITSKRNKFNHMSIENMYLPKGKWIDLFTKEILDSGKHTISRELNNIPVFLKESSIVPLSYEYSSTNNPETLEILSYSGDTTYELFEDDGISNDYKNNKYSITTISNTTSNNKVSYKIDINNSKYVGLNKRNYIIKPIDIIDAKNIKVLIDNKEISIYKNNISYYTIYTNDSDNRTYNKNNELIKNEFEIIISNVDISSSLEIIIDEPIYRMNKSYNEYIDDFISKANIKNISKHFLDKMFINKKDCAFKKVNKLFYPNKIKKALKENIKISS